MRISSSKWKRFIHNPRAIVSLVLLGAIFIFSLVGGFLLPDPAEIVDPDTIKQYRQVQMRILPDVKAGRLNIKEDFSISSQVGCEDFSKGLAQGAVLTNVISVSPAIVDGVKSRFANQESPEVKLVSDDGIELSLLPYKPRGQAPKTVRLRVRDVGSAAAKTRALNFVLDDKGALLPLGPSKSHYKALISELDDGSKELISQKLSEFAQVAVDDKENAINVNNGGDKITFKNGTAAKVITEIETIAWPFRPVPGHPLGIDSAGRDLLSRIVAGTRIALLFGLVLVASSMIIGIAAGAVQGYYGGIVDMGTQRFIEIWSSLPFLYVMILVGSVFGRSFGLLLFCYGLFNWIGISYYMRAEFLRLRSRPFVEAARCQGLSAWRIIWRHILPNALTPVVTLLPFSLIGAISSISALDFLGFGLPPLTPSLGELLGQAQLNASAWWLTLYPSLVLFTIMLLSVFVGEGLRDAFDPKPSARYR